MRNVLSWLVDTERSRDSGLQDFIKRDEYLIRDTLLVDSPGFRGFNLVPLKRVLARRFPRAA